MKKRMKILLAYDGSDCAKAALDDIRNAGLPTEAEAIVLAVAENWMPPPSSYAILGSNYAVDTKEHLKDLHDEIEGVASQLKTYFPNWTVSTQVLTGSPAREIVEAAELQEVDLIIVGSHGRSALGRFILGSVSSKVVTEAHCPVRIARGRVNEEDSPVLRLIIGFDASHSSVAAVYSVASRNWPANTEVKLLTVQYPISPAASDHMLYAVAKWVKEERQRIKDGALEAQRELERAGLKATAEILEGEAKNLICEEAERWGADCIFVGAHNQSKIDRFMLGSVSAAIAARAHCSVEVIHTPSKQN
ncbi:MAG TPA: universal stress protein [Blastocatellia bacterium]|nr:universal stress protein [Blastocatellia bacterium]